MSRLFDRFAVLQWLAVAGLAVAAQGIAAAQVEAQPDLQRMMRSSAGQALQSSALAEDALQLQASIVQCPTGEFLCTYSSWRVEGTVLQRCCKNTQKCVQELYVGAKCVAQ